MSRPIKTGIDYFPLDVNMDDKIELIEAKHGIEGFGILIKLYQKIYKEGYFLKVTEELLLIIAKRINVNINDLNAVINDCLKYDIFNNDLYKKYKILTSTGIQKRFFSVITRRKEVELIKEYIIADISDINVNILWKNVNNNTQSKVKKRKVENNINIDFPVFWDLYNKKVGSINKCSKKWNKLKNIEREKIINTLPAFILAIKEKQFQPYPETYLNNRRWEDELNKQTDNREITTQDRLVKFIINGKTADGYYDLSMIKNKFVKKDNGEVVTWESRIKLNNPKAIIK